ncbi:hypothetical protein [Paenibacillus methanolicus]|uniref:Macroglobulin domain-containing protein n=1 Tax=Paenibacillus methanolicus TaxID=582686 RepID=A0A5S5BXD7_9BACL|nr:hypothetical protein [Paenibacillus methanolicus]TYP70800.1 hypothetical protein BCM02_111308 [Paenibacillus methanolicus]
MKKWLSMVVIAAMLAGGIMPAGAEGEAGGVNDASEMQQGAQSPQSSGISQDLPLPAGDAAQGLAAVQTPGVLKLNLPGEYIVTDVDAKIRRLNTPTEDYVYAAYDEVNGQIDYASRMTLGEGEHYRLSLTARLVDRNGGKEFLYHEKMDLTYDQLVAKSSWEMNADTVQVTVDSTALEGYGEFDVQFLAGEGREKEWLHNRGYRGDFTLLINPSQVSYAWSTWKNGIGYIHKEKLSIDGDMTFKLNEQDLGREKAIVSLPLAASQRAYVYTTETTFQFPSGVSKLFISRGRYAMGINDELGSGTELQWHSDYREITEDTAYEFGQPGMVIESFEASRDEINADTPVRRGDFELRWVYGANASEYHAEYELKHANGARIASFNVTESEDAQLRLYAAIEPSLKSGKYLLTATVTYPGFSESLTANRSFEILGMDSNEVNGSLIRAENETGAPLQNGQLFVYEAFPYTYELETPQYYYSPIFVGEPVEPGAFFVPNAYLLAGRRYEVMIIGQASNSRQRVVYHKTITGGQGEVSFHAASLSKTIFASSHATVSDRLLLSVMSEQNGYISWPMLLPFEQNGQAVAYVQTSNAIQATAVLHDSSTDRGYYLERALRVNQGTPQLVNLEGALMRLTPPAGFQDGTIAISSSKIAETSDASEYYVNQGTTADVRYAITKDGYRYTFRSAISDIQQNVAFSVGSREVYMNDADVISAGRINQKVYTDFYEGSEKANLVKVEPLSAEKPAASEGSLTFKSMTAEGPRTITVEEEQEGLRYPNPASAAVASLPTDEENGESVLEYQLVDKDNREVGERIRTSSFDSVEIDAPRDEGEYRLQLVNQLFPDDLKSYSGQTLLTNIGQARQEKRIQLTGSAKYPVLSWGGSGELWSIGKESQRFLLEEDHSIVLDAALIKPDANYVLHIQGGVLVTGVRIPFYTQLHLTGEELLRSSSLTVAEGQAPITIILPTNLKNSARG